ncbi:MAG: thioredoxin fold domain-containing protein [Dehalococcoidia bacterium]|nr:thioredoxin fold domain-containing protein [Dehalococcoidia bacterium]
MVKHISIAALIAVAFISCSQAPVATTQVGNTPANSKPVIENVSYVHDVDSKSAIEISCQAGDRDGDLLSYEWLAQAGYLKGEGATVNWTAPDNDGEYTITIRVNDGRGGTASRSIVIKVSQKEDASVESDLSKISLENALVNGKHTLADFGWKICIPCKAMKPILEELAVEYGDRVNVLIVEVYDPAQEKLVTRYGIKSIPTQVFFDENGKEVTRHIGYISKEDILIQLNKMGVR